jgi:predicted dehydrogenase
MSKNKKIMTRREFVKNSIAAGTGVTLGLKTITAPTVLSARGTNKKIRVGFIGVGNRGSQLLHRFMANKDVEVAALCDVYEPYTTREPSQVDKRWVATGRTPKMGEKFPNKVDRYNDFRKMLEDKSIDAVCIATPDHLHAVQMIMSVDAGKDVYVEKPLTSTVKEGRAMVDAQKRTNRVVVVGLNRRGSSVYQNMAGEIQGGKVGKILTARAYRISNMYPNGIGNMKAEKPPKDFDWDLWLGPRPYQPYQYNIAPYSFRWWKSYSTQMGNWGVHYMDAIRWFINEQAPLAITTHGGNYILKDDRTIPDTMEVTFEMASGTLIQFHIYEGSGGIGVKGGEVELNGTKGTIAVDQNGYVVTPARPGQFQDWEKLIEPETMDIKGDAQHGDLGIKEDSTANLIRNFLDCIKSRKQPWCTIEDGHRSTTFAHLANISLEMGKRIEWDAETERITNSKYANNLLHYEYRKPWSLG